MFQKILNYIKNLFSKPEEIKIKPPVHPTIEELNERNQKIRESYENKKPENEKSVCCPNCRRSSEATVECEKCKTVGCDACFTYDPMSNKHYCDDCW